MAIYHMSVQTIGRANGGNSIAAAAYRAGKKLGEFDYSKKEGVEYSEILVPKNSPEWAKNREKLWQAVELSEKRKDAQLCREINIAFPLELKPDEQKNLVQEYAAEFVRIGMVADIAIHKKDNHNPHAHIMLTMRELCADGFGKKNRDWNRRELLEEWREKWAELANKALERAGHVERIDHRSLQAQGIDREPTIHQGKSATWLEKREPTHICALNQCLKQLAQGKREIATLQAELKTLESQLPPREPEKGTQGQQEAQARASAQQRPLPGFELIAAITLAEKNYTKLDEVQKQALRDKAHQSWKLDNMDTKIKIVKQEIDGLSMLAFRKKSALQEQLEQLRRDYSFQQTVVLKAEQELTAKNRRLETAKQELLKLREDYRVSPYGVERAELEKLHKTKIQAHLRRNNRPAAEYKTELEKWQAALPSQRAALERQWEKSEKEFAEQQLQRQRSRGR